MKHPPSTDMDYDELPKVEKMRTKVLIRRESFKHLRPCTATRKHSFPNKKAALYHQNRLLKTRNADHLRVYKCPHCRFWHLTSQVSRYGKR